MPYERPTLLKVTMQAVKCDLVEDLNHPIRSGLLEDFRPFTWNFTWLKDLQMTIRSTLIQRIYPRLVQWLESNNKAWSDNLELTLQIIDLCFITPFYLAFTHFSSDRFFTLKLSIPLSLLYFLANFISLLRSLNEVIP